MIAKESILKIKEFYILNSTCVSLPIKSDTQNTSCGDFMSKYPVEIDFDVRQNEDDSMYVVFVKVAINKQKDEGYSIVAEGCGIFEKIDVAEDEFINILLNSGVSICITNLRSYVANITSYYPLGRFNFHSIDMQALLKAKRDEQQHKE